MHSVVENKPKKTNDFFMDFLFPKCTTGELRVYLLD